MHEKASSRGADAGDDDEQLQTDANELLRRLNKDCFGGHIDIGELGHAVTMVMDFADEQIGKYERAALRESAREAPSKPNAIDLARRFHTLYEGLAPKFDYKTRPESAKPWSQVPPANQNLMIAVCEQINL